MAVDGVERSPHFDSSAAYFPGQHHARTNRRTAAVNNATAIESPTLAPALGRVPGLYRAMYAVMSRSHRVHGAIGTVQVTALGMFAGGGGFAIAPPSLASLAVVVGGISSSPVLVDGHIQTHDLLDLTVTIDHNVVDGAPATRFAADLRQIMQQAAVLLWAAEPPP